MLLGSGGGWPALFGDDPDAAVRLIDNWESSLKERAAQAKTFAERGAGLTATASDPDGVVEVTVDSTGVVTALNLSQQGIRHQRAAELSELIMSVMRKAQAKLSQQMAEVASETMGADSDATKSIVSSYEKRFPAPPEEQPHAW